MSEERSKKIAPAVVLAQHGNKNACRDIYIQYYKEIYFICYELTENPTAAMKLTEEIFIKMFESVEKLDDHMAFEKWFYSLAVNMCREHVAQNDDNAALIDSQTEEYVMTACAAAQSGDDASFENGIMRTVENIITSLPAQARIIFIYHYFANIETEKIAAIEHISEEEAESAVCALELIINKKAEKIKELGLDISLFIDNMENTLYHIAAKKFVPSVIHSGVSEKLGVDVNPFAPSPKEKEEMEQAAKEIIRKTDSKQQDKKVNLLSKSDLILFFSVIAAVLIIFTAVRMYRNSKDTPTTTAPTASAQSNRAVVAWNGAADTEFDGGDGTENSPYQIATGGQLAYLANLINDNNSYYAMCHYVLTSDIILNKTDNYDLWAVSAPKNNWIPIGYSNAENDHSYFMGVFDGAGHTVSGLYINSESDYCGLFGLIKNGTVKDLNIEKSYVSGGMYTGGIVGYYFADADEQSIEQCSFSGIVKSGSDNVGGIAGYVRSEKNGADIKIDRCAASGKVSAKRFAGGIVGVDESADGNIVIENCFSTSSVSVSESKCGGIAGAQRVAEGNASVKHCYYSGKASGQMSGGIVGESSCVTGTGVSQISYCYYLDSACKTAVNKGAGDSARLAESNNASLTSEQAKDSASFDGFDFANIWEVHPDSDDYGYPVLKFTSLRYCVIEEESLT